MNKRYKLGLTILGLAIAGGAFAFWYVSTAPSREPSLVAWNENCAICHGSAMEGTARGPSLASPTATPYEEVENLIAAITLGNPGATDHIWGGKLTPQQIKGLALLISERRQRYPTTAASYELIPSEDRLVESQHHDFRLERITTLNSRPYSIAPLPNGDVLVAEKTGGLSVIGEAGEQGPAIQSPAIDGTPEIRDFSLSFEGSWLTLGSLLDVELHPEFDKNGWIYLSHADRCDWLCGWIVPGTMVRVVRGRISDGKWVDEEVIWSVHTDHYTPVPDAVAGGRLAFDKRGYLYVTVGGKNTYDKLHDLNTPFGKVHRVHSDGKISKDNPFWVEESARPEGSTIHTVWSYGHRTGQGLDGHPVSGEIWNSEMGPRGGDEINHILRGQNYGWPLYTNGLDYSGDEVSIGRDLGLDYPLEETVLPIVDFTPAPAVSSFAFHHGDRFTKWNEDILLGTLKESALYRIRIESGELVEREKLVTQFGRIRDVAMGFNGLVYLAIEHGENGSLWRLTPANSI